jgi:aspartate aminotransferase
MEGVKCNKPDGAFYLFPDVSHYFGSSYKGKTIANGDDFCMFLLSEGNIALVDGKGFGAPNCIRISYAASEENLMEAMKRMKAALEMLTL